MDYDAVLEEIGEFGWWQRGVALVQWVPAAVAGIHALMFSFTGLQPGNGFRCRIPICDGDNFTFGDFPETLFPRNDDNQPDYCKFKQPTLNITEPPHCDHNSFGAEVSCTADSKFTYNSFQFEETLVTEWDLVCDQDFKVSLVISMYMVGLMIGSFGCGWLADAIGRKKTLFLSILIASTGSLVGAFMPEYYSYTATRVVTAIGAQGQFLMCFAMTVEIVGNKEPVPCLPWVSYQTLLGIMVQAPFAVGMCILTIVAMYTPSWYTLQWTVSAASFIQLCLWFVCPESPRWLSAANKKQEFVSLVTAAAKRNGRSLTTILEPHQEAGEGKEGEGEGAPPTVLGIRDLFSKELWVISSVMFVAWPVVTMGYYGITFGLANLSDDLFLNFIVGSLIEIPAYIAVLLLMDIVGRKPLFSGSLLFTGVACIICGFLEEGGFRTVLAMTGKFFAAGNFSIVYMYTAELYPTIIRSTGVGVCSVMARIGGAIPAPYIALYLPTVSSPAMPYLVMGGASVVGGFMALLLPETLGSKLPETLEDVARMKANQKPMWKCINPCARR